jgi:signal transduction histidine kinase
MSAAQDGLFLGGRVRSDIHLMRRQVRRLAGLIDELLDVSRITSGKLHILPEPVDLGALLRDVVTRFEPEAERVHSEVELDVIRNPTGQWDRLRLEQVVENLLANALKYGGGQPVRVIADICDGQAVISVEDHGIGIAPDALDRIFGRFERAVSERHYGGLGLGLYVARQIVGAMEGNISVTSRPGEGATFTVELPLDAGP